MMTSYQWCNDDVMLLSSVIGTPTTDQWPSESSITVDQFVQYKIKPWTQLLPEACEQAQNLLSVRTKHTPYTVYFWLIHVHVALASP